MRTVKQILDQDFEGKTYEELEDLFEEHLNEVYGTLEVCGLSYEAGSVLKEVDPTAFRCGCSDWTSEEFEEGDNNLYYSIEDLREAENTHFDERAAEEEENEEENEGGTNENEK